MKKFLFISSIAIISLTLIWLIWIGVVVFLERIFVPEVLSQNNLNLFNLHIKWLCRLCMFLGCIITMALGTLWRGSHDWFKEHWEDKNYLNHI